MNKKSALISRIKNGIMSIIYRLKEKNTEPGVTEEKEQPVDSEPISRSENKTETHSPENKELIIDLKKELGESIDTILNKLFDGISGLLEKEYKDRLDGLEKSIEDLKGAEEKGGSNVFDFISIKELEKVRDFAKISLEESEIEKLKEKIEKIRLIDLPDDKIKGFATALDYINHTSEDEIRKMRAVESIDIGVPDEKLERVKLIMGIASLLPEEDKELPELKENIQLFDFLNDLRKRIDEMKIQLEGVEEKGGISTVADYINHTSEDEIRKMRAVGSIDIGVPEEKLERVKLIMGIASLLPEEDKELPKLKENIQLFDFLNDLRKRIDEMEIQLLYNKGVMLLKKRDFKPAYECFDEITKKDSNLKGAWLNRGVALGELGKFDEEINSYNNAKALSKDKNYKKAQRNMKIAERKKRIKKKRKELLG